MCYEFYPRMTRMTRIFYVLDYAICSESLSALRLNLQQSIIFKSLNSEIFKSLNSEIFKFY
jgi:hypothetical protein